MDFENDSEQNLNPYDDDHDSDLEARLYAEIHFSNDIIGEESNNQPTNIASSSSNKLDNNGPSEKIIDPSVQTQTTSTHNNTSSNNTAVSLNEKVQNYNKTNKTSQTPQKRSTVNDSNDLNSSSKKRKPDKNNESEYGIQGKEHDPSADLNMIINPYNKNVNNTPVTGMKLLSPEFINLLFKNLPKKKKHSQTIKKQAEINKNLKQTKNKIHQQNKIQNKPSRVVVENETTNTDVSINKAVQQNIVPESSSIIDISSEDSVEDDSKYKTTVATDKKLTKKKAVVTESEESPSDSEESIFEVPVPPKPAPPVIELKDSGSEDDSGSESEDDSSSTDSAASQKNITQNNIDKSLNSTSVTIENECIDDSTSNELDNIVLNCTEIQKGVSSISEIKEMTQLSNKEQSSQNLRHDTQTIELQPSSLHTHSTEKQKNNSAVKDKVANTLNKKKSDSCINNKTLSNEEYFFQPMNDKMKAFYNESWGGENFDMDKLKSKMSSDPNKWAILNDDIVASFAKRKRYFGMVCSRCHKEGHRQNQCTEIIKLPTCHMCGITGHIEISCPKKMCLTCGRKQNMYRKTCENCRKMFCTRCESRGHMSYSCPDLWRRYHQTINKANAEPPDNLKFVIKSRNELQCCNCARKGHVSAVCSKLRWSQHFPNPEHVTNYNGPAYYQDCQSTENANDTIESSFNQSSTCDRSLNIDSTVDNSINLSSSLKPSFQNQSLVRYPPNNTQDLRSIVLFHIKPKLIEETMTLKTNTLILDMRNKNSLNDYGNWIYLEKFFNSLMTATPGEILMEQSGKQVKVKFKCVKKYRKLVEQLIQQYASRNNSERSHMLMSCERGIKIVANNLTEKFNELNNLDEDPVQLHEESRRLNWELANKENRILDNLDHSLKVSKLALCQRKLLMILYREGFLDDSLKRLRNIHKTLINCKQYRKNSQKSVTLKNFFSYLHYFNNVFSPHEHTQLNAAMRKFQEHLARCDRLKNNPLLFPQIHNELVNDESNQNESYSNTSEHIASNTPSTSYIPPLLPNYTPTASIPQFTPSKTQSYQKKGQEIQHKNTEQLRNLKKHPRGLFLESVQSKSKKPRTKLKKKLNNFQEETKKLINTAKELNLPHLHKHIDILQKKMQNEIYVYEKDVKLLKQHVNEELKRRGERRR